MALVPSGVLTVTSTRAGACLAGHGRGDLGGGCRPRSSSPPRCRTSLLSQAPVRLPPMIVTELPPEVAPLAGLDGADRRDGTAAI
ncbi:MAG: hypothetical protein WDN69_14935 [Aliidongia sp.]